MLAARAFLIALTLVAPTMSAVAYAGPDAAELAKRAEAAIKGARTYQATWVMTTSMGQMGSMSMNMDLKMVPSQGKVAMRMTPAGQATGMMAMGAAMANTQVVDDGKTMHMYMQAMNGYYKSPHTAGRSGGPAGILNFARQDAKYKLVRMETVGGRPCYVIAGSTPPPAQFAKSGMTISTLTYIDQATHRVRQIKSTTTMPGGMMGGMSGPRAGAPAAKPAQPMVVNTVMVVKSEVFNARIADSAFKFVPPPGAKELKGNPGAMGGLGMGMPAGR